VFTGKKKHRIWSTDFVVVGYCTNQLGIEGFDWSCDQWQVGAATHDEEEAEFFFWN
jgi:hypothetical protein